MEPEDDDSLERLLQAVGRRELPPPQAAAEIRAAVHGAWRETVTVRARRRQHYTLFAAAAGIAMAAIGAWLWGPGLLAPTRDLASVSRIVGEIDVRNSAQDPWTPLQATQELTAGMELRTAANSRVALRWRDGGAIRLDQNTMLSVADDRLALRQGAVYLDTEDNAGAKSPGVATSLALVKHLGTRYEVRSTEDGVGVRVRDGKVAVEMPTRRELGFAGEKLQIDSQGRVQRTAIPAYGSSWAWLDAITPPIDIEGLRLSEFLDWVGRETGRKVVYVDASVRSQAEAVILRGTISGLDPQAALTAVLATTRLQPSEGEGDITIASR
jgi:ferric-dicitrate binding protein FerR (iron transport regulator)